MGTAGFRRQHDELLSLATELLHEAAAPRGAADPAAVRRHLAQFSGRLKMHSAMEDEALYPRLFVAPSEQVRAKAKELHTAFGTIYSQFLQFAHRWVDGDAIEGAPDAYAQELREIIGVLGTRIALETRELYPLVDALEG